MIICVPMSIESRRGKSSPQIDDILGDRGVVFSTCPCFRTLPATRGNFTYSTREILFHSLLLSSLSVSRRNSISEPMYYYYRMTECAAMTIGRAAYDRLVRVSDFSWL